MPAVPLLPADPVVPATPPLPADPIVPAVPLLPADPVVPATPPLPPVPVGIRMTPTSIQPVTKNNARVDRSLNRRRHLSQSVVQARDQGGGASLARFDLDRPVTRRRP